MTQETKNTKELDKNIIDIVGDYDLETGRHFLRAINEYDEVLYEVLIKHANCIDNDEEKYHDGTADYDNDVVFAELWSIQAAIDVMTEKYYNVKMSGSHVIAEENQK